MYSSNYGGWIAEKRESEWENGGICRKSSYAPERNRKVKASCRCRRNALRITNSAHILLIFCTHVA